MNQFLSAIDEAMFQKWYRDLSIQQGRNPDDPNFPSADDPEHYYDLRKAFLSSLQPYQAGHLSSTFKKVGHPRMFLGGVNTSMDSQEDIGLQGLIGRPPLNSKLARY